MTKHQPGSASYILYSTLGGTLMLLGFAATFFMIVAKGDGSRYIAAAGGLLVGLFGIWIIRRVDKNIIRALLWMIW